MNSQYLYGYNINDIANLIEAGEYEALDEIVLEIGREDYRELNDAAQVILQERRLQGELAKYRTAAHPQASRALVSNKIRH